MVVAVLATDFRTLVENRVIGGNSDANTFGF